VSASSTPIEAGVSAAVAPPEAVLVFHSAGQREHRPATLVRNHDFRQSGFLAPSELRRIRLRHEQFIRSLAARLAIFLRLEVSVQLTKVQITSYQKFAEALGSPTHITLFRTEPLKGVGLLVIPPRLGLGFVDRLLGGPGQMPESARELSEIEIALIDQIATLTLGEWCAHWPEMKELRPALLGHENNSRFLQTAAPDTAMLVLTVDTGMGGAVESVQLAFPYATVEPLMKQLAPALPEPESVPTRSSAVQWNAEFDDLKVKASVEWQGLKITAAEITRLKKGDVLMLAPECAGLVQLSLGKTPKFAGKPGVCGKKWAVQLTDVLAE
jgi:flagellar motor switch protein FliM